MKPIDVLHIIRTNSFLRQLVRNNDKIWRIARQNLGPGFPDCPPDISEIKYAIFVFGKKCMICGASGPLERKYTVVLRACHDCLWSTLLGTKDPVCVRTRGMVSTLGYDGLRGLLHPIPGTESCQSCYTKGQPGVAEGYDSSDILKLQRDLRQAKKVVEKHKVVKKWEEHFSVRAELRGSIAPWMRLHEPFGDEAAIIQFRGFQIMMKLYAKVNMDADGITHATVQRFVRRKDRHHKRIFLQPRLLTDEEWEKIGPRLLLLCRPPPETRSK